MITVQFFTSNSLKLVGNVYLPEKLIENDNKKYPTIILCQGLSGVKHKVLPQIAETLIAKGYIVLAFDYRGCGESEGEKTRLFPLERVSDILHAVEFMRSFPNVDVERTAVYGLSYGAATCLYAAALDEKIKCVVSVSGAVDGEDFMRSIRTSEAWIDFKKKLEADRQQRVHTGKSTLVKVTEIVPFGQIFWEKYNHLENKNESESIPDAAPAKTPLFTLESAEAMIQFNISSTVKKMFPRPVLIIHAENDNVVAIEDVYKIYNKLKSTKNFICIKNSDHIDLDNGPGLALQVSHALAWFNKYL